MADGAALSGAEMPAHYRRGGLSITTADLSGVAVLDVHVGVDRSTLEA